MVDTKLSNLPQGTRPTKYYGHDGSLTSQKYSDLGWYNVKNYGAVGDGATDDAAAIQAAVNAATTASGGVIFFPVGNYKINTGITFVASSQAALRILGCGGTSASNGGTCIISSNKIWMFHTDHSGQGCPISSIEGITFIHSFNPGAHGSFTSTEPADGGFGCVYNVSEQGPLYLSCGFFLGFGGICVFESTLASHFDGCVAIGNYTYTHAEDSIGFILASSMMTNCKIAQFGIGVCTVAGGGGSVVMDSHDMEENGCAVLGGDIPIGFWDAFFGLLPAGNYPSTVILRNMGFESNGSTDASVFGGALGGIIRLRGAGDISNIKMANLAAANGTNGIVVYSCANITMSNVTIFDNGAGKFTVGGININGTKNAFFDRCTVTVTGVPNWILIQGSGAPWFPNSGGYRFRGCNTDGAVTATNLPRALSAPPVFGSEMVVSDSVDPAWTAGGVSNVGKPITGGGVYKVKALCHADQLPANGSWTTSTNLITMAATIPAWVVAGMNVMDITSGNDIGVVSSGAGTTTLHLVANAASASSGTTDILLFYQWVIAG